MLFVVLACTANEDPLAKLDKRYTEIMVDVGIAERDTARNISNKEARRRKSRVETERVEFFRDPKVAAAIEQARSSDDPAIQARGEAYHRHQLQAMGWTEDDKVQEERLVGELEEARRVQAVWSSPDGGIEVPLSLSSWTDTSREADELTPEIRAELAQDYVDTQMDIVVDRLQALARLRNEVAKRSGYANYWELSLASHGLDPKDVDQLTAELVDIVTPINTAVQKRTAEKAEELGLADNFANRPLLRRAAGLEAGRDELDPFADVDRAEETVTTALQDMGLSTEGWQIYTGPSRTVRSGVYGFPIRPPVHVALVMSIDARWSIRQFELMAHEAGHLVWWTNMSEEAAASPPLWHPPAPWAEGFAGYFESLIARPAFLAGYLSEIPSDKAEAYAQWTAWHDAEDLSRHIVTMIAERRLYEDPNSLEAITRTAAEAEQKLFGTPDLAPQTRDGLYYVPGLISSITWNYPGYRANFLKAAVVEAQVAEAVASAVDGPVGNPQTGPFLVSKLIRGPVEQSLEERLAQLVPGEPTAALRKRLAPPPAPEAELAPDEMTQKD